MENLLIAIVILLAILVVGLLAVVIFFLSKLLKNRESSPGTSGERGISPEVMKAIEEANHIKTNTTGQFCVDHSELLAKGMCAISNEVYCDLCITKENEVKVARKYLDLWLDSEWEDVYMVSNQLIGADKLNELIRLKKELWKEQSIPIITQKQFKINIENDRIEAYTMVKGRKEDEPLIKSTFDFLNS